MPDIVEIARFSSDFEAQTALALLRSVDIEAKIVSDDAGGALPSLAMLAGGVGILVRAVDAEAATKMLVSLADAASDEDESG
ncbi:MAG: hypothetical protein QGM46_08970 [Actinomycetota bacterium]|nr:hypothetical protein [Actinomycetota bacterium]